MANTGQDIIREARREVIETVGTFWSDSEILDLVNRAEADFFNKTRFTDSFSTMSTVAGQRAYTLPNNWVSSRAIFVQTNDTPAGWRRVKPTNLEKVSQEQPNFLSDETERQGMPNQYWIWNKQMYLSPTPDATYTVAMFHKGKPVKLIAASQSLNVDDSLFEGILAFVLWKMWKKENELDRAQAARADYEQYVAEGRKWVKKQTGDQKFKIDIESGVGFNSTDEQFNPLGSN
jgi:hypothetical protein